MHPSRCASRLPRALGTRGRAPLAAATAVLAIVAGGCLGPPTPFQRLGDVAYETNTATRFGRFDVAVSHVASEVQEQYAARHGSWGNELRVLDVELTGVRLVDPDTAEVSVVVQWHRIDETHIRTTQLAQRYRRGGEDWQLFEERRTAGAPGLFRAERPKKKDGEASPDGAGDELREQAPPAQPGEPAVTSGLTF
ncbi:MAG: hypothetical protein IT373_02155 [Polyangiaceae bacterium]|nr:hypothetical protein [Polyangiaceae bacterium]